MKTQIYKGRTITNFMKKRDIKKEYVNCIVYNFISVINDKSVFYIDFKQG